MKSIQNTSLSCGLLNAPVKIFAAAGTEPEVKFKQCGPEGEDLERLEVVKEEADERDFTADERRIVTVVDNDKIEKSYNGHLIPKADLEAANEESLKDEDGSDLKLITIESFVPLKDVPMERATKLYYIGPDPKVSTKSFRTFKEALKKKKAAAVAKVVIRSRQIILAIYVKDDILHASVLSFAATMNSRVDEELTTEVDVVKAEVGMMGSLIDSLMADASSIDQMEDTYVTAKRELVEKIIDGQPITKEAKPKKATKKSDSLMESLKASVEAASKRDKAKA